ncbi:hypothetical protein [Flavobacterium lindanitolerans]|uniref:hypothetical protein n=1 Tax=Flavobacterium lindanitolerans TaxID=428988 RepID=UPI0023F0FC8A|nr:hypothetical protein [Flavobacterium lindanitolerans]
MKRESKKLAFVFSILALSSCSTEEDFTENKTVQELDKISPKDEKSILKEKFAFSLMKSIKESPGLREIIKDETLKMFNKDYEVLVYTIKDYTLENGMTLEQTINQNADSNFQLSNLLRIEPTLTLLVPELPLESFSAKKWNTQSEIPAVAIRTNYTNQVPLITPDLNLEMMPSDVIPGFPVIVVKNNERVVSNLENPNIRDLKTTTVFEKDGIIMKFWTDSFNNADKRKARLLIHPDRTLISAYTIYDEQSPNLNGWQRDFIYYKIQPSSSNGPFIYDFKEHLRSFSMTGDPTNAYNRISDQTGDPTFRNNHRINTSHWTGGFYEFKVRAIINAKNGVGNELINGFTVSPDDLFFLEYETYTKGTLFWEKTYYRLKNISNKTVYVDVPLINWDLDEYASSIKIEIEEVDLTITSVITDTRTVKFATNFGIDTALGVKTKIGLKFGASVETIQTQTVQKTFTQGNNFLGEAIVNFADKVIIRKTNLRNMWVTRDYITGSGYCEFSIEPKKVQ